MKQQTSVGALMVANEVFSWACPGAGDYKTQCTPDSQVRSGYRKLPALYSPTARYKTAGDVQSHRKNRKFFKRVGTLSKATLWQALAATENIPEPYTTDTKGC